MAEAGLIRSMSKIGCLADNAACEGFFGRLKNEMFYTRSWTGVRIDEFIDILSSHTRGVRRAPTNVEVYWLKPPFGEFAVCGDCQSYGV
jgi:transposase InsO family protein